MSTNTGFDRTISNLRSGDISFEDFHSLLLNANLLPASIVLAMADCYLAQDIDLQFLLAEFDRLGADYVFDQTTLIIAYGDFMADTIGLPTGFLDENDPRRQLIFSIVNHADSSVETILDCLKKLCYIPTTLYEIARRKGISQEVIENLRLMGEIELENTTMATKI